MTVNDNAHRVAGSELKNCEEELIEVNYFMLGLPKQPSFAEENKREPQEEILQTVV